MMFARLRIGITAKLFIAIFSTCMLVLATMHWGVRLSFEHGFIDYIKKGNEQRLNLLAGALADQYEQHGNWDFCVAITSWPFKSCIPLSKTRTPARCCRLTAGVPSSG